MDSSCTIEEEEEEEEETFTESSSHHNTLHKYKLNFLHLPPVNDSNPHQTAIIADVNGSDVLMVSTKESSDAWNDFVGEVESDGKVECYSVSMFLR